MSAARCRPGDLDNGVESFNPKNLGRIVKVVCPHQPSGPLCMYDQEPIWDIESESLMVCTVGEKVYKQRVGPCPMLSKDDIAHYQKVVVVLSETIRVTSEIDEVIEQHEGWPGAFQSTKH